MASVQELTTFTEYETILNIFIMGKMINFMCSCLNIKCFLPFPDFNNTQHQLKGGNKNTFKTLSVQFLKNNLHFETGGGTRSICKKGQES